MKWAMELAPPMPAQLVATLSGLAYHADSHGRGAYPSIARLAAYACKDKRSVQRDIRKLVELEFIRLGDQDKAAHLPEGKRPEVYDLAVERTVPGGRAADSEVTRTSRVALASSRRRGGKKKPSSDAFSTSGTGDVGVTPGVGVTRDVDVADGVTWASQEGWRGRHPNQLPKPTTEPKDIPAPPAPESESTEPSFDSPASPPEATDSQQQEDAAFAAFYSRYPRKVSKGNARKAFAAAVKRGVKPEMLIAAAEAHRDYWRRARTETRFIPHPATWLNSERYDDELAPAEPRTYAKASGDYEPWRNPQDTSGYYEEL